MRDGTTGVCERNQNGILREITKSLAVVGISNLELASLASFGFLKRFKEAVLEDVDVDRLDSKPCLGFLRFP
jgi:hypothetical protein